MIVSTSDEDGTPRRPHDDIPDGEQQSRIDRARQDGARTLPGDAGYDVVAALEHAQLRERLRQGRPDDIVNAFRQHDLLDARPIARPVEAATVRISADELRTWFVVKSTPRREDDVDGGLRELGLDAFCPKMRFLRTMRRSEPGRPKKEAIEAPLFVGYVFAGFPVTSERHWLKVRRIEGVHSVLGHHGTPQPVSRWIVDRLMADQAAGMFDSTAEKPKPQPGQNVRVKLGPFAGIFANVERLSSSDRVKVLLKILGGMVSVDLGIDDVEIMA